MKTLILFFGLSVFLLSSELFAYPSMIQYGYPQCSACHYSPQGGGLLSPYGIGIADAQSLFPLNYDTPKNEFYRVTTLGHHMISGLRLRGMFLSTSAGTSVFPMQTDYLNSIQPIKQLRLDTAVGYVPHRARDKNKSNKFFRQFVIRKAMLSYRAIKGLEFSAGRDFLPIGINLDNHSVYVRERNRRNVTDFNTEFRVDYWTNRFEITPFGYLPSYQESKDNQEKGAGLRLEYFPTDYVSMGASGLLGYAKKVNRQLADVFFRFGNKHGGAQLEYDFTYRENKPYGKWFAQQAAYVEPFYTPVEWLKISAIGEYLKVADPYTEEAYRGSASIYFRTTYFADLIAEARYEHKQHDDGWTFFVQLFGHV